MNQADHTPYPRRSTVPPFRDRLRNVQRFQGLVVHFLRHTLHEELYHQILIIVDEPDWAGKGGRISGVFELRQREKGPGFAPGGVVCSHLAGILSEPQAGSKVFLF